MHTKEYWEKRTEWEQKKLKEGGSLVGAPSFVSDKFEDNPVDIVRTQFLTLFIRESVVLGCHGQCFLCSDYQVLACLVDNLDIIDNLNLELKEV